MIYLDNAATTQIHPEVFKEMTPFLTSEYGNAGSLHSLGRRAADAVSKARERVAKLIGASPEQIIFTSGGTEANNLAIKGVGKRHILTSRVEHDSIINVSSDCLVHPAIPVNEFGKTDNSTLKSLCKEYFAEMISVMYANNEVGTVNNVAEYGEFCRKNRMIFHTDCVQAAGFYPINVDSIKCDMLSLSSHKIHGPKGVGALYVRDKSILSPIIKGGAHQEFGIRGGTENVAGIVGFGKACEIALEKRDEIFETVSDYRYRFYDILMDKLGKSGLKDIVHINGYSPSNYGKVLNLRFEDIDAETLVLMLDTAGVCVSAGSACRSHESEPSRVLLAMGLSPDQARDSVRFSFSDMNTAEEMEQAAKITAECVKTLHSGGGGI